MSLSTHVLDTARGEPVAGMPVRLERLERPERRNGGGSGETGGDGAPAWAYAAHGSTDADGRLSDWVPGERWGAGRYRLVFETAGAFFPEVTVVFEVTEPQRHHHVPLLLSPYGYTTYRGS